MTNIAINWDTVITGLGSDIVRQFAAGQLSGRQLYEEGFYMGDLDARIQVRRVLRDRGVDEARTLARKALRRRGVSV